MKIIALNKEQSSLIAQARRQDRKAQHQIFNTYAPKLLSVCRYYIRNIESAEEVLLTGFLKAFLKIEQYDQKGSFEGWLRKIIVNEALSFLRQKTEFKTDYFEDLHLEPQIQPQAVGESTEAIQQLIDSLPTHYKTVFVLYVIEGYSHKEIALELEIPVNTSKSYLLRARKKIQEQLKGHYKIKAHGTVEV